MTKKLSRQQMAQRVARDIPAGSYVNLGIGLPVMALEYFKPEDEIMVHSENGILGMRGLYEDEAADPDMSNAAKLPVSIHAGGSFFHHADSFAMMRGGHLDFCILGGYQISERGDLANWSLGQKNVATAVGGAMDLAVGAKAVYVLMEHVTRDGKPRIVRECTLPLTGHCVVKRIYTDLAVIDVREAGLVVIDMVPAMDEKSLQECTGAPLRFELQEGTA